MGLVHGLLVLNLHGLDLLRLIILDQLSAESFEDVVEVLTVVRHWRTGRIYVMEVLRHLTKESA